MLTSNREYDLDYVAFGMRLHVNNFNTKDFPFQKKVPKSRMQLVVCPNRLLGTSRVVHLKAYKTLPSFTLCVFSTIVFFIGHDNHFTFYSCCKLQLCSTVGTYTILHLGKYYPVFQVIITETILPVLPSVSVEEYPHMPTVLEKFKIPVPLNQC